MIRVLLLAAASAVSWPSTAIAQVVYAWGSNVYGQLGNGSTADSNVPVAVSTAGVLNGQTVTGMAAGARQSMAVANGQVFAWGNNEYGQLGNGSTTNSPVPAAVSTAAVLGGLTVTAVAGGLYHNLAVANGQVYAWGYNVEGELGNGTYTDGSKLPVAVSTAGVLAGKTVTAVAAGNLYSLAVADGQAFAWGLNNVGQMGTASPSMSDVPVAVSTAGVLNGKTVTAVAAGAYHSLAVANGQVFAWGINDYGDLGNASTTDSKVPVAVSTAGVLAGKTVTAVAAGGYHSLAVANGQVFAWGYNGTGQLGNGTTFSSDVPEAVNSSALSSLLVTEVAAAVESSYALTSTGRLFAWGGNSYGELGIGSTGGRFTTPQEVLAPAGFVWTSVDSDAEAGFVVAIATPVPEPGTYSLLAAGLSAAALCRRRGVARRLGNKTGARS